MKKKILIVDDMEINREMLAVILGDMYCVAEAEDGARAIEYIAGNFDDIAAILLDLVMPNKDGYDVLEYLKERDLFDRFPVIVISAEDAGKAEQRCLDMGVHDFIHKPFDSGIVRRRVGNSIELFAYKNSLEDKVKVQMEALQRQNHLLEQQAKKLRENNEKIIDILGTVVEYRNLESGEHIKRVKGFTRILANKAAGLYPEYKLTPHRISVIVAASALHDIGKIVIKDSVLLKPGKFTPEEYDYMKSHTTKGCDIIDKIDGVWDREYEEVSREICRHHHERYDGKGYPDGLVGEDIPLSAQIVSIADVYDALVSERVYKDAYDKETAYHMILRGECGVFSPKLLECFRSSKAEFEALAMEQGLIKDED